METIKINRKHRPWADIILVALIFVPMGYCIILSILSFGLPGIIIIIAIALYLVYYYYTHRDKLSDPPLIFSDAGIQFLEESECRRIAWHKITSWQITTRKEASLWNEEYITHYYLQLGDKNSSHEILISYLKTEPEDIRDILLKYIPKLEKKSISENKSGI